MWLQGFGRGHHQVVALVDLHHANSKMQTSPRREVDRQQLIDINVMHPGQVIDRRSVHVQRDWLVLAAEPDSLIGKAVTAILQKLGGELDELAQVCSADAVVTSAGSGTRCRTEPQHFTVASAVAELALRTARVDWRALPKKQPETPIRHTNTTRGITSTARPGWKSPMDSIVAWLVIQRSGSC